MDTLELSNKLIEWYNSHARDLPWRRTTDPYKIWISEIVLQQTTVAQGTAYYNRFITAFPSLKTLAEATLDEVLKMWEGLGYYSRARNLHFTAQHIQSELAGVFPDQYEDILKLKGIGPYTAAAVGSFCFGLPHVVVDGNVIRFISRLYGITDPVDTPVIKKKITQLAQALLEHQDPATFNQAIMEMGALSCKAKIPLCATCIYKSDCKAFAKNKVAEIPLKSKKLKKRKRYFQYLVLEDNAGQTVIEQRSGKDIWQGLWQFPLIENDSLLDTVPDISSVVSGLKVAEVFPSKVYKQQLTHQTIHTQFFKFRLKGKLDSKQLLIGKCIKIFDIPTYAFPKSIAMYLEEKSVTLF